MHVTFKLHALETPYITTVKIDTSGIHALYCRCIIDAPTTRCIHGIDALRNYNS